VRAAQIVGLRLSVKQATKYIPLAGQAVSALVGYSAIRYLGESHIRDCVEVARSAQLMLPAPAGPTSNRRSRIDKPPKANPPA